MIETRETGLFEQIPEAVLPLTADGDFRLDRIEYFTNGRDTLVYTLLRSPVIDILYVLPPTVDGKGNVSCTFTKQDKHIEARFLFPAFNINIPVHAGHIHEPPYPDYIHELSRLATEIKKNLPEILALFTQENVDETFRYTLAEMKKEDEKIKEKGRRWQTDMRDPEKFQKFKDSLEESRQRANKIIEEAHERVKNIQLGHRQWYKGKLGGIAETVIQYPQEQIMYVTYHVAQDTVDALILTGFPAYLFVHQESNTAMSAYFLLPPSYPFIKGRADLIQNQKMIVYPAKNVFQLLGIAYSYEPKGYLIGLGELCRLIRDNLPILCEAFSEKNIEKTYNALISTNGNNDEEIQNLVRHYFAESFADASVQMQKTRQFSSRSYYHGDTL